MTAEQRVKVKELMRELYRARNRDARLHARLHRAQVVTCQSNKDERRLATVVAARDKNEEKLRKIIGMVENLGLRLSQIAREIVMVDEHEDAAAERQARERARAARADRKEASERRSKRLMRAFDDEQKQRRQAARGARFNIGAVYTAVATANEVSTTTVRRAWRGKQTNSEPG